jgi:leucyl/phenylalanyl-tRNA---protein transferase
MPIYRLDRALRFPDPSDSEPDGLLAVGGDLSPERLLIAYASGIFPWYSEGQPILWHSPDPRAVLLPTALRASRSLRKALRRRRFEVRLDTAFEAVVRACAQTPRRGAEGTWITREMQAAYIRLHALGFAHCAETWVGGQLVGGLYGVSLGGAFFGESMFSLQPDASKVALAVLVHQLARWGFDFVDCQIQSAHLERLGADCWPRARFLEALADSLTRPTRTGTWRLDPSGGQTDPRAPTA